MHELSIAEALLKLSLSHAEKSNAKKVTAINIVIGRLSSIVDDSIQFYWDFIAEDSICKGAILHFDRRPAVLICKDCNHQFTINSDMTPCPTCGSYQSQIISGEEFFLESIEIEKDEKPSL
ncbi:MAG: hydrogenase maturation nickel metallochaperone HypA [Chloroflexi bacterium]|nr:hydrogenase maturation nickel metallochaperone HypA [Chloroflexota bacterium]